MLRAFNGKAPQIAPSAYVSEAAYIIGDVEIGENSSVWPGAVIRGDLGKIKIGRSTAVEDNCVIHSGSPDTDDFADNTVIGDEVHIGHGAVVNCRRIGNNVLIGMNATVLHDVEIGNSCIIGAGCLVTEGMRIPDGSFVVGVPGKIKSKVAPHHSFWFKDAPQGYIELSKLYKEQGL
jgi:carbonic anhydrase/acetyltransferase-like protein (isoleucine patch superfamily)